MRRRLRPTAGNNRVGRADAAPNRGGGPPGAPPPRDQPLVLALLNYAVLAVKMGWNALSDLVWYPVHVTATSAVVFGYHQSFHTHRGVYAVMWLPRWVLATSVPLGLLAEIVGVCAATWSLTRGDHTSVRAIVALAATGTSLFAMIRVRGRGRGRGRACVCVCVCCIALHCGARARVVCNVVAAWCGMRHTVFLCCADLIYCLLLCAV